MQADIRFVGLDSALLKEGLITQRQLQDAREQRQRVKRPLTSVLVEMEVLSESSLLSFFRKHLGFEVASLPDEATEPVLRELVPKDYATRNRIAPVRFENGTLVVAMEDPTDHLLVEDLSERVGLPIRPVAASSHDITAVLADYPDTEDATAAFAAEPARWYRILSYSVFPILLPAPIGLLLGLMAQPYWPLAQAAAFDWVATGFDFGLSFCLLWGTWSIGLWYVNGVVFPRRPKGRGASG